MRKIPALCLLLLLLFSLIPIVSAGVSQTWYLTDIPSTELYTNYVMTKGSGTGSADVIFYPGFGIFWISDESATYDVNMAGTWNVNIVLNYNKGLSGPEQIIVNVDLGYWVPAGQEEQWFHGAWSTTQAVSSGVITTVSANPTIQTFVIPAGSYVSVNVYNHTMGVFEGATGTVDITGGLGGSSPSYISSPTTDPGYPVPELSTFILTASGLIVVGAVSRTKKWREGE